MKIVLVMLDEDERAKGRRFMKRVKDRFIYLFILFKIYLQLTAKKKQKK